VKHLLALAELHVEVKDLSLHGLVTLGQLGDLLLKFRSQINQASLCVSYLLAKAAIELRHLLLGLQHFLAVELLQGLKSLHMLGLVSEAIP